MSQPAQAVPDAAFGCCWLPSPRSRSDAAHAAPHADPTGKADADRVKVLAAYQALGAGPVASLTVEQARTQPMPGMAAMQVQKRLTGSAAKQPVAKV